MAVAIKVLAWYTVIIATFSAISTLIGVSISKQTIVFTPLMCWVNIVLLVPIAAFGILVIVRMRRRD